MKQYPYTTSWPNLTRSHVGIRSWALSWRILFLHSPQIDAGWNQASIWTINSHGDPEAVLWWRYPPNHHERKHREKISCPRDYMLTNEVAIDINVFCALMIDSVLFAILIALVLLAYRVGFVKKTPNSRRRWQSQIISLLVESIEMFIKSGMIGRPPGKICFDLEIECGDHLPIAQKYSSVMSSRILRIWCRVIFESERGNLIKRY